MSPLLRSARWALVHQILHSGLSQCLFLPFCGSFLHSIVPRWRWRRCLSTSFWMSLFKGCWCFPLECTLPFCSVLFLTLCSSSECLPLVHYENAIVTDLWTWKQRIGKFMHACLKISFLPVVRSTDPVPLETDGSSRIKMEINIEGFGYIVIRWNLPAVREMLFFFPPQSVFSTICNLGK